MVSGRVDVQECSESNLTVVRVLTEVDNEFKRLEFHYRGEKQQSFVPKVFKMEKKKKPKR